MMANNALNKKRAEKAALQAVKTVTIKNLTLEASEEVLGRLAALMQYSDPTKPLPALEDLGPMPWDEQPPKNPQELELDYTAIRNAIIAVLPKYVARHGQVVAAMQINDHGGQNLKTVPDGRLLDLLAVMEAGCE